MKWKSIMMKAILLVVPLSTFLLFIDAQAVTINIVSDTTWTVYDTNGADLGNAQSVCLNATAPPNCPAGSMYYEYPHPAAWATDLSTIPGAKWIWAPNINGQTSPAANAEFTFQKEFYLCGAPQEGTISVAADDTAEVYINGTHVLTAVSHSALRVANIPAKSFAQGINIIQVKVRNGPNPSDCGSDQYHCNPAGVVLGASFADALNVLPTCTDNRGTFPVGHTETRNCPKEQGVGSQSRTCICIGSIGLYTDWSKTCTKPTTCTDNGKTFNVGDIESLKCDQGYVGSKYRTCQPNGNMVETNTCHLPPVSVGDICGSREQGYIRDCPSGTDCKPRALPPGPRPWQCVIFGIDCPVRMKTADWFCDP